MLEGSRERTLALEMGAGGPARRLDLLEKLAAVVGGCRLHRMAN